MFTSNRNEIEQENLTKLLEVHRKIEELVGRGSEATYIGTGGIWFGKVGLRGTLEEVENVTICPPATPAEKEKFRKYIIFVGETHFYSFVKFVKSVTHEGTHEGTYEGTSVVEHGIDLNDTKKVDEFIKLCEEGEDVTIRQHRSGGYRGRLHYIKNKEVTLCKRRFQSVMDGQNY